MTFKYLLIFSQFSYHKSQLFHHSTDFKISKPIHWNSLEAIKRCSLNLLFDNKLQDILRWLTFNFHYMMTNKYCGTAVLSWDQKDDSRSERNGWLESHFHMFCNCFRFISLLLPLVTWESKESIIISASFVHQKFLCPGSHYIFRNTALYK